MSQPNLIELEAHIARLSHDEQPWLLARLAHYLRAPQEHAEHAQALALMADDPDIQRELRCIDAQFTATESDGLG